ncbi:MAG: hypothetical protein NZT92_10065, partial [Abditibacteriales bacterium]|nr:hypothetical protein [Abditibacteriales bacterium]MDW8366750.1 hypothetical protein [Abditibacteriales bacterium]
MRPQGKETTGHWSLVPWSLVLCTLIIAPAGAQTARRINRCRTNEITIATLQRYGVDIRRSPVKRQTGRGYPRGTIGTSLMP